MAVSTNFKTDLVIVSHSLQEGKSSNFSKLGTIAINYGKGACDFIRKELKICDFERKAEQAEETILNTNTDDATSEQLSQAAGQVSERLQKLLSVEV